MAEPVVVGGVVFRKGETEDGSDFWDDTALIEAYDKAVSVAKAKLVERGSISEGSLEQQSPALPQQGHEQRKHKKNRRKHKKDKQNHNSDKHNNPANKCNWQPGDHCRAVYTEDGQLYEAVIRSINEQEGTCLVRYLGYGNEEDQAFADILPLETRRRRFSSHPSEVMSEGNNSMETDEIEWMQPHQPGPRVGRSPRSSRGHQVHPSMPTAQRPPAPSDWAAYGGMAPPFTGHPTMPPMPPPMPFMPGMMPQFPMPSFPMPSFAMPSSTSQNVPVHLPEMPPPPLLDEDPDTIISDKEALHSMLLSWYMSGYHTGYYQALKQARKCSGSASQTESQPQQAKSAEQTSTKGHRKQPEHSPPSPTESR